MRLGLFLVGAICFGQGMPFPGPGMVHAISGGSYLHYRTLTVDHTKVPNTDQTTFPVTFRSPVGTVNTTTTAIAWASGDTFPTWMDSIDIAGTTYTFTRISSVAGTLGSSAGTQTGAAYSGTPYLKTVANGGLVQNTTTQTGGGSSLTVPADAIVTSDSGCATKLPVDWESYSATTGVVVFWYKQTLTTASDTVAYNCYDNSSVTTYQGNVNGVWDANFITVAHLPDGSSLTTNDSTGNGLNLTNNASATATPGEVDGGVNLNSTSQYLSHATNAAYNVSTWTAEAWVYLAGAPVAGGNSIVSHAPNDDTPGHFYLYVDQSSGKCSLDIPFVAGAIISCGTVVSATTWTHIAATKSGNNYVVYFNGVSDGTATDTNSPTLTGIFQVGSYQRPSGSNYLNGKLDEVRFSGSARSADWLKTEVNNASSPFTFITVGAQN